MNIKYLFLISLLFFTINILAQEENEIDTWDNQIYLANKVSWGSDSWKYSGEIQVRFEDNMQALDRWYIEGVVTYLLSKKIEISPDFRITIKPDKVEFRPGLGVYYKLLVKDFQFVNQFKWQIDFDTPGGHSDNALRYALFINHKINDKLISNFGGGVLYRWKQDFTGVQFVRFGPGLAYVVNKQHTINFNYFLSAENDGQSWSWAGIPVIQLIININKDYKYLPAKYFSF